MKGKPFLLCVGAYEQPYFYLQGDRALRRVLFGYDQPLYIKTPKGIQIVGEARRDYEEKDNGARLDFGIFTRPGYEEISGIVFSCLATMGKCRALGKSEQMMFFEALRYDQSIFEPKLVREEKRSYSESLLDGLYLCLNPYATNPIDVSLFDGTDVAILAYNPKSEEITPVLKNGFTFTRNVLVLQIKKDVDSSAEQKYDLSDYEKPSLPWKEGELHLMQGGAGATENNHLAHYRGWTILVGELDGDWCGYAINTKAHSLQAFIESNQDPSVQDELHHEVFESVNEASLAMQFLIDKLIEKSGLIET